MKKAWKIHNFYKANEGEDVRERQPPLLRAADDSSRSGGLCVRSSAAQSRSNLAPAGFNSFIRTKPAIAALRQPQLRVISMLGGAPAAAADGDVMLPEHEA